MIQTVILSSFIWIWLFFVILNSQPECKGSVLNCHTYSEDNFSRDIDKFKNGCQACKTAIEQFEHSVYNVLWVEKSNGRALV